MAKFRDSNRVVMEADVGANQTQDAKLVVHDRTLGDIIRQTNNLTADQIERVLTYQREKGVRFGEAAIALGLASNEDILFALSQQFHYPYAPEERHVFSEELVVATKPFSPQAEAFRAIRSQLIMRLFSGDTARPAIAVVSPESGDGKSFFAANLAVALSQLGGRTLLVDGDMRSPRQHQIFGLENSSGLSGILAGRSENSVIQQVRDLPSLFVLPVGAVPPNPLELLERPAFGLLIRELLSKFDFVVVDTPAARRGSDSSVLAARCGAALAIARKGSSSIGSLQDMVAALAETPAKLAGVIMNEF
ncbi:chain length determinant protein tyrosine kinase EpsG [soil metagenome]